MANPEHIEWLLEGVEAWNARRIDTPFVPDLSGANIPESFYNDGQFSSWQDFDGRPYLEVEAIPLSGVNFAGADLTGAILSPANFAEAIFRGAKLVGADLSGTSLTKADLSFANLYETDLSNAGLRGVKLEGTNVQKAHLYWQSKPPEPYELRHWHVKTVSELLNKVLDIDEHYQSKRGEFRLYFRGECRCGWPLRPSIMRGSLVSHEGNMLEELASRRPEEFKGLSSALEQWVLAQHHKLSTRFLDVTKNPLVALFNACGGSEDDPARYKDEAGRLHIFVVPRSLVKPFTSDTIRVIASFAKLSQGEQIALQREGSFGFGPTYSHSLRRLYYFIRQENPYFEELVDPRHLCQVFVVEPQQTPERVRTQSGAFLVSALHSRFEKREVLDRTPYIPIYDHFMLTIPSSHRLDLKTPILKDLAMLNITRETLFPGLDSSAEAINKRYSGGG